MVRTPVPLRGGSPQALVRQDEVVPPIRPSSDEEPVESSRGARDSFVAAVVEAATVKAAKAIGGAEGRSGSSASARIGGAVAATEDVAPAPPARASPAPVVATEGVPGANAVVAATGAFVSSIIAVAATAKVEPSLAGPAENPTVIDDSDDDDNGPSVKRRRVEGAPFVKIEFEGATGVSSQLAVVDATIVQRMFLA